ncbi:MAG: ATPase component of various ABC-type transport system with duplicated ATPase domain [Thermoleophilia bacterium]|nr:ATPase component of various ABC-type transport system with duplicated ATPase domain [Thermoleophilia bacterium]
MVATRRPALGAGAALAAWASMLIALNLTAEPVLVASAFASLALLAVRSGMTRMLVLALVVGAGLLVVVPGVAVVDGSFSLTYGAGVWSAPSGPIEWLGAIAGALRIPAQVLATCLLAIVPAELLLATTSRLSPRTALLAGLAARLRPLLARDLRGAREELGSRGRRFDRGAPLGERAGSVIALWEATISGMLDRAFQTAATLETRGFGVAPRPTTEAFRHEELRSGVARDPRIDRLVLAAATLLVVGSIAGRAIGAIQPPPPQLLTAAEGWPGGPALALAALAACAILAPLRTRMPAVGTELVSVATVTAPEGGGRRLELRSVSVTYPGAHVASLHDASLVVEPGELVVVTGASGSGKSTLLDAITGVAPSTTGGTRTGQVLLGEHVRRGIRSTGGVRIAAVFQDPETQVLVGRVAEEVAFGLRHAGIDIDQIEVRVLRALDRMGLRHLARRDCASLSGGELQRVLLAAALAIEPALLVLDEPTSQVDALSERRFWDAVDEARRDRGIGVLLAEHRLDHVRDRADRVLVCEDGHIVADVRASELATTAPALLADAYAGLVPNPPATDHAPRLVVTIDRLDVPGVDAAPPRTLLRGLALALPARSIVTLEGPNGTGKSTLLRAIRGLHPSRGGVRIDGRDRTALAGSVAEIGFLSQGAGALLPGRTVRHAIELTCRTLGRHTGPAHEALAAAGLSDRLDAHPSELSVGERQRLALVAATAHRPVVWLLDEPTRGMDARSRHWVACHLLAHAAAGGVVLVATHDPALAAAIATHRLRLDVRTGPTLIQVARDAHGALVVDPATPATADRQDATP